MSEIRIESTLLLFPRHALLYGYTSFLLKFTDNREHMSTHIKNDAGNYSARTESPKLERKIKFHVVNVFH